MHIVLDFQSVQRIAYKCHKFKIMRFSSIKIQFCLSKLDENPLLGPHLYVRTRDNCLHHIC